MIPVILVVVPAIPVPLPAEPASLAAGRGNAGTAAAVLPCHARPGRDRLGAWLDAAAAGLLVLAAAAAAVSFSARYRLVCAARRLAEGNRNVGLFWAASRALEADQAAGLSSPAAAARQAGLGELEIARTLNSARRTGPPRTVRPPSRRRTLT